MDGILERVMIGAPSSSSSLSARPSARRRRVVIIGAGFGGLSVALRLGRVVADVTVIDRRNHHLFQPLLYQVATAALSPADIAAPIRGVLSRQRNTDVILGTVTGVDVVGHEVLIGERPTTSWSSLPGRANPISGMTSGLPSPRGSKASRTQRRCAAAS